MWLSEFLELKKSNFSFVVRRPVCGRITSVGTFFAASLSLMIGMLLPLWMDVMSAGGCAGQIFPREPVEV